MVFNIKFGETGGFLMLYPLAKGAILLADKALGRKVI